MPFVSNAFFQTKPKDGIFLNSDQKHKNERKKYVLLQLDLKIELQ